MIAVMWWRIDGAAELLAWRAALTGSPREAEQALVQIAREHPTSRRRENALLRLAQFQIAKGDARNALTWLDLLYKDYPAGAENVERQYWTARALLAGGDTTRACKVTQEVAAHAAQALGGDYTTMSQECVAFDARMKSTMRSRLDSAQANGAVADSGDVRVAGSPIKPDSLP
jgi:hypothetical protein